MEDKDWKEFLKTKRKVAKTAYSLRRICAGCGHPIVNVNRSGYCGKCLTRKRYDFHRRRINGQNESSEHNLLKSKAIRFLETKGYSNIRLEAELGVKPSSIRADVYGILQDETAIVECGGSSQLKLIKASAIVKKIYILPYGENKPYPWNNSILICHNCGHSVGHFSPQLV